MIEQTPAPSPVPEALARRIRERIAAGRGQGEGPSYLPWLTVQGSRSLGQSGRVPCWTTGRVHHVLSQNWERRYLLLLNWSPSVTDIREQYPLLPLEETLGIAARARFRHPSHKGEPVVMTTDFVATIGRGASQTLRARCVKPEKGLDDPRTIEKLEIERRYWQRRGVDWGIVTEHELPAVVAANIDWFHSRFYYPRETDLGAGAIDAAARALTDRVQRGAGTLAACGLAVDEDLRLEPGSGLAVARFLLATRQWEVDLSLPLNPRVPLSLARAALLPTVLPPLPVLPPELRGEGSPLDRGGVPEELAAAG